MRIDKKEKQKTAKCAKNKNLPFPYFIKSFIEYLVYLSPNSVNLRKYTIFKGSSILAKFEAHVKRFIQIFD